MNLRPAFVNAQTNFFRPSEGDKARLRMIDDHVANFRTRAGHEVDDTRRHARLFQQLKKLVGNRGRIGRWFQNRTVPRNDGCCGHSRHDGARKIPWGNHCAHTQRNVFKMIFFAGYFSKRLGRRVAQYLMRVELAEIDRLSRIAIGFRPGLRHFINHPGRQFMFPFSHQLSHSKQ